MRMWGMRAIKKAPALSLLRRLFWYPMLRSTHRAAQLLHHIRPLAIHCATARTTSPTAAIPTMSHSLYTDETPASVKEAKGLHLITQNTPNGKKVQIFLEELKDAYGTEWTTTLINIITNEQKKDWFLRLNPNGIHSPHLSIFKTDFRVQVVFQSLLTTRNPPLSPLWKPPPSSSISSKRKTKTTSSAS